MPRTLPWLPFSLRTKAGLLAVTSEVRGGLPPVPLELPPPTAPPTPSIPGEAGSFLRLECSVPGCPEGHLCLTLVFAQLALSPWGFEEVRVIPASGMSLSGILEAGTEGLFQTHIGLGEEGGF